MFCGVNAGKVKKSPEKTLLFEAFRKHYERKVLSFVSAAVIFVVTVSR